MMFLLALAEELYFFRELQAKISTFSKLLLCTKASPSPRPPVLLLEPGAARAPAAGAEELLVVHRGVCKVNATDSQTKFELIIIILLLKNQATRRERDALGGRGGAAQGAQDPPEGRLRAQKVQGPVRGKNRTIRSVSQINSNHYIFFSPVDPDLLLAPSRLPPD